MAKATAYQVRILCSASVWLKPYDARHHYMVSNRDYAGRGRSDRWRDGHDKPPDLTALLFLVFDVEIIFLFPWAVELRKLGMFGFVEALIFVAVLFVALVYAWQRGALDWD